MENLTEVLGLLSRTHESNIRASDGNDLGSPDDPSHDGRPETLVFNHFWKLAEIALRADEERPSVFGQYSLNIIIVKKRIKL